MKKNNLKLLLIFINIYILSGCNLYLQIPQIYNESTIEYSYDQELSKACLEGNLEEVEKRLKNGSNINVIDFEGYTPFLNSVRSGNLKLVNFLLKNGANIRDITKSNKTNALMIASAYGYKHIVEYLLSYNSTFSVNSIIFPSIDIQDVDKDGRNALFYVNSIKNINEINLKNSKEVIELLLSKGLNINSTDSNGNNIIFDNLDSKNIYLIDFLISKGLNINNRNDAGNNSLEKALIYNIDMAKYLIEKGVNLEEIDKNKNNIVFNITKVSNESNKLINDNIFKLILSKKIDLNHRNLDGDTPLIYASKNIRNFQSKQIILFLLENGADPNIKNNTGNTYLDYLFLYSDAPFLKTLIEKKYLSLNYKTNEIIDNQESDSKNYLPKGMTIYKKLSLLDVIISNGGSLNEYIEDDKTLLQYLIEEIKKDYSNPENLLLIKKVINDGADIYLNGAILDLLSLNYETYKYILSDINYIDLINKININILFISIKNNLTLDFILSKGFDINTLDKEQNNLLMYKLNFLFYDNEFLFELIDKNININQKNNHGGTALIYAIKNNNTELALRLIDKGADLNIKENHEINETPLSLAKKNNMTEILNFIEKRNIK